jgi:hypothetical protein
MLRNFWHTHGRCMAWAAIGFLAAGICSTCYSLAIGQDPESMPKDTATTTIAGRVINGADCIEKFCNACFYAGERYGTEGRGMLKNCWALQCSNTKKIKTCVVHPTESYSCLVIKLSLTCECQSCSWWGYCDLDETIQPPECDSRSNSCDCSGTGNGGTTCTHTHPCA